MIRVVAGIVWRDREVLVSRRYDHAHLGGLWEFPGGKLEPGETEPEALVRELREELGIEVEVGEAWGELVHDYEDRRVSLSFWFAEVRSGSPQPLEVAEVRWVPVTELDALDFPGADDPLVHSLQAAVARGETLTRARRESD